MESKESKILLFGSNITCAQNNNYIIFIKSNNYYNYNNKFQSILFEKKQQNKDINLNNINMNKCYI